MRLALKLQDREVSLGGVQHVPPGKLYENADSAKNIRRTVVGPPLIITRSCPRASV